MHSYLTQRRYFASNVTLKVPSLKVISPSVCPDMTLVTASARGAAITLDCSSSWGTYVYSMTRKVICSKRLGQQLAYTHYIQFIVSKQYHNCSQRCNSDHNQYHCVFEHVQSARTIRTATAVWYTQNVAHRIRRHKYVSLDSILSFAFWATKWTMVVYNAMGVRVYDQQDWIPSVLICESEIRLSLQVYNLFKIALLSHSFEGGFIKQLGETMNKMGNSHVTRAIHYPI